MASDFKENSKPIKKYPLKKKTVINNNNETSRVSAEDMEDLGVGVLSWDTGCFQYKDPSSIYKQKEDKKEDEDEVKEVDQDKIEEEDQDKDKVEDQDKVDEEDKDEHKAELQSFKRSMILPDENIVCKKKSRLGQGSQDVFSWLSDEIVLGILRHIPQRHLGLLARVCQRFRQLVMDESLWKRLDLAGRYLPEKTLAYIVPRQTRAFRLARTKICRPAFGRDLSMFDSFVFKVEYLDLSESTIHVDDLELLLSMCCNIKKLSLEGCELSHGVLIAISKNRRLSTLNLVLCTGLTQIGVTKIVKDCTRLESFNMGWTNLKHHLSLMCESFHSCLKEINFSGTCVLDRDIEKLVKRCPHITELDLSDCWVLGPYTVKTIIENLREVKGLSLSRCFKIQLVDLYKLRVLPQLQRLNIYRTGLGEPEIAHMVIAFPGVKINNEISSRIARPTVGDRRTSIWQIRCRD